MWGSMGKPVGDRRAVLLSLISIALFLVGLRVLILIVWEYQNYFPPNFRADFLFGREEYFFGWYGLSFYVHIVASPVALVLGFLLIMRPKSRQLKKLHRPLGKVQAVLVVLFVVPSGLMMAIRAIAGPVAGFGLAALAVMTATTMVVAVNYARKRQIVTHQVWATRCFILLCSPLLLRLMTGAEIVLGVESSLTYQLNAWLSWLVPLFVYEVVRPKKNSTVASFLNFSFTSAEGAVHDY